jgi:hypothetical protein
VLPSTSSVSSQAVREAGGESTESDTSSVAAKGEKEPSACAGADSTGHRQQPLVGDSVGERCRVGGGGGGLSATAAMPATPQELHALVMRGVPAGAYAAVPDASEEWRARIRAARRRAAVPDAEYELPWRDTYGSDEEREVLGRAAKTIRGRLAEVASWAPAFSRQAKERYEMAVPRQEYVVLQPGYLEADDAAEESVDLGHFEAMCPSDAGPSGAA